MDDCNDAGLQVISHLTDIFCSEGDGTYGGSYGFEGYRAWDAVADTAVVATVAVSLDGAAAVDSYDADLFVEAFASASGLDAADVEVETSVKQDLTLVGVTELSEEAQDILVTTTADSVGVEENAVSISVMSADSRRRLAGGSLTVSMEIVVPAGSSVADIVASAEGASDTVVADLAEQAGIEVTATVEVTGLAVVVTATVADTSALDVVQGGDDFLTALEDTLTDAGIDAVIAVEVDAIMDDAPTAEPTAKPTNLRGDPTSSTQTQTTLSSFVLLFVSSVFVLNR